MGTGEISAGGNPAMDWHPIHGGVEIFLVASSHGNRDKLWPDGPLGSYADLTFYLLQNKFFPLALVRYEIVDNQLGATRLVSCLTSHIQRALVE